MWWQVRALLDDRPGTLAALAAGCGREGVNILALEVHPCLDDRVVDELVLRTAQGWTAGGVEQLVRRAGATQVVVSPCSPHVLQDQPMRYMRAAGRVMRDPHTLEEELRSLFDAATGSHTLVLDGDGRRVVLERAVPFTATEVARARELNRLAGAVSSEVDTYPVTAPRPKSADEHPRRVSTSLALGKVTTPLVSLLHQRPELREVCPAANLLDQAVRGGA